MARKVHRMRFVRVLKKHLNIEPSWDRFPVNFRRALGGHGTSKKWFSHRSGYIFSSFGYLKIRRLLNTQKPRFGFRFGAQVGQRKRTRWLQEACWPPKTFFPEGPEAMSKNSYLRKKTARDKTGRARQGQAKQSKQAGGGRPP